MEKQKLPNATTAMVLSITGLIGCCCTSGILGSILSIIALFLISRDERLYLAEPQKYENYSQLQNAKIIAIVALVLSLINFAYLVYMFTSGGFEAQMEQYQELLEQFQSA